MVGMKKPDRFRKGAFYREVKVSGSSTVILIRRLAESKPFSHLFISFKLFVCGCKSELVVLCLYVLPGPTRVCF